MSIKRTGGVVFSINKKLFSATDGVAELLLSTDPKDYTDEDLNIYKSILEYTSAHTKNHQPYDTIVSSRSSIKCKKRHWKIIPGLKQIIKLSTGRSGQILLITQG